MGRDNGSRKTQDIPGQLTGGGELTHYVSLLLRLLIVKQALEAESSLF